MAIRAGELDQRVTIVAPTVAQNALNEDVSGWADLRTIWAAAKEGLGREFLQADQVAAQSKVAFKIRFARDITTNHRARWSGTLYEIIDITGIYRSGEMWLHCQSLPGVAP